MKIANYAWRGIPMSAYTSGDDVLLCCGFWCRRLTSHEFDWMLCIGILIRTQD